jgi:predicted transcriptional regulator
MSTQHIHVGVEDAKRGFERFVAAWHTAQSDAVQEAEVHLNFEDFARLASVLTPKRLELLKILRQQGPLSVRALSKTLERDYKNVHVDASALEAVDLIQRDGDGLLIAPWDVIDAHVRLVA